MGRLGCDLVIIAAPVVFLVAIEATAIIFVLVHSKRFFELLEVIFESSILTPLSELVIVAQLPSGVVGNSFLVDVHVLLTIFLCKWVVVVVLGHRIGRELRGHHLVRFIASV
jgi:hypothetical protein